MLPTILKLRFNNHFKNIRSKQWKKVGSLTEKAYNQNDENPFLRKKKKEPVESTSHYAHHRDMVSALFLSPTLAHALPNYSSSYKTFYTIKTKQKSKGGLLHFTNHGL